MSEATLLAPSGTPTSWGTSTDRPRPTFNYEILALELYRRSAEYVATMPDHDYTRLRREKLGECPARLEAVGKALDEA